MTDLQATVATARSNLRKIWDAHAEAIRINLDYGPGAWTADGMPHHRNPPAEGSILHYRGQDVTKTDLSAAYDASVRQLAAALVPASEISWIDDGVSQGSVLPHNQSHIPLSTAQSISRLVNYSLITTQEVLAEQADSLTLEVHPHDAMYIEQVCEQVLASLLCLPDDLVTERPKSTKVNHPTHKRCKGGPGRSTTCSSWIAWSKNPGYCKICARRFEHLLDEHPGHRGEPCRNPWGRDACKGTVDVPKYSLCTSCNVFRLNSLRPADARLCMECQQQIQDRGTRCYACRQQRTRSAS